MQKLKSWSETLDFMYQQLPMFQRIGAAAYKKDLTNTIKLSEACGNPHLGLKSVHIAGTNGKGTTSHIIASGLQSQGYSVGVYTSPHYIDFRERIKINGIYISKKYIRHFLNAHLQEIEEIQPSFFELTVVLAFKYFVDMKVDIAVIETGLGGRLDSTNIVIPLLSVITNISFDHMAMLGNTLPLIAGEKAGIIKKNIPVVVGESQEEVKDVFINKAKEMNASLTFADKNLSLIERKRENGTISYDIYADGELWQQDLRTDLIGPFQSRNLITGLFSLKMLSNYIKIDFNKVLPNFVNLSKQTAYMGRWQILDLDPMILADSAHNTGGISLVVDELQKMKKGKLHMVIGFVNDKDLAGILEMLPKYANYYFAKANIPRGLDANTLKDMASPYGLSGKSYHSVRKAFSTAKQKAAKDDIIFVGGSIFVVGEVLEKYKRENKL